VVSGAAGATGSVVGQICKMKGARVIGLAGSDDKCQWLKDTLGFDEALNYKSPSFRADFKKATPKFIDVYWDNVGGEILELALSRANKFSRFVMCGSIGGYNAVGRAPVGIRNIFMVTTQRIRMEGFIVFDYRKEYPAAREELRRWMEEGKLQRKEHIVEGGIRNAEKALKTLFDGGNTGKLLLEVKPYEETTSAKL
jgi:NADPH-dependent curcumin reductase CurA